MRGRVRSGRQTESKAWREAGLGRRFAEQLLPFVEAVRPGFIQKAWLRSWATSPDRRRHQRVLRNSFSFSSSERVDYVVATGKRWKALLKRWLVGTHHEAFSTPTSTTTSEFTFRFNRRRPGARGLLFHRLAQQAVATMPAPYNSLVANSAVVETRTNPLES